MSFERDRFSQLAGLEVESKEQLNETKQVEVEASDEDKLRSVIRREAKAMLKESVTMGFGGPGFGGPSLALGGPMTSARQIASHNKSDDETVIREGVPTASPRLVTDADTGRRHLVTVMDTDRRNVKLTFGNSMSVEMRPDDARWLAGALDMHVDTGGAEPVREALAVSGDEYWKMRDQMRSDMGKLLGWLDMLEDAMYREDQRGPGGEDPFDILDEIRQIADKYDR
jgi:hypothetical protein